MQFINFSEKKSGALPRSESLRATSASSSASSPAINTNPEVKAQAENCYDQITCNVLEKSKPCLDSEFEELKKIIHMAKELFCNVYYLEIKDCDRAEVNSYICLFKNVINTFSNTGKEFQSLLEEAKMNKFFVDRSKKLAPHNEVDRYVQCKYADIDNLIKHIRSVSKEFSVLKKAFDEKMDIASNILNEIKSKLSDMSPCEDQRKLNMLLDRREKIRIQIDDEEKIFQKLTTFLNNEKNVSALKL